MSQEAAFGRSRLYAGRLFAASIAPVVDFSARFMRTIVISRFLTPADYGVVVAMTAVYTVFEIIGDLGLDRFVVIHSGPRRAEAVAAAQQIALIRGILIGALIFFVSPLLATLFGAGGHTGSIKWLALLPVIRSLTNYRMKQVQQHYNNRPEAIAVTVAHVAALLSVAPALHWFPDERTMLVSLYVEAFVFTSTSWLIVRQERTSTDRADMRRAALAYGLPLILNGIGLAAVYQFDRFIVGHFFGLETLALYSLVINLALLPLSPLSIVVSNLGLAFVVSWNKNPTASKASCFLVTWVMLAIAAAYAIGVGIFLDLLVPIIYGQRYSAPPGIHALVCLLAFLRCSRLGPTTCLLAFGATRGLATANLLSGFGIAIAYGLAAATHDLEIVLGGLVVGEFVSALYLYSLIRHYASLGTVAIHAAILVLPAIVAAYLSFLGPTIAERAVMLASSLIIASDIALCYRRYLAPLRDHGAEGSPKGS